MGLLTTAHSASQPTFHPFSNALRDLGYAEGRDLVIEIRRAEGVRERLPALAAELVDLRVEVIVTSGGVEPARAVRDATSTIPIVFTGFEDPVGLGIVSNPARPEANLTGVVGPPAGDLAVKRVELLKETVPGLSRVAVLYGPDPGQPINVRAIQESARNLGVDVRPVGLLSLDKLDDALEAIARERPDGIADNHGSQFYGAAFAGLGKLLAFAVKERLPQIYNGAQFARAGGLMGHGSNTDIRWRRVAQMVDRILNGAKPQELPVEVTTVYELVLNRTMAHKIGLTFPESVLRQATEIVE